MPAYEQPVQPDRIHAVSSAIEQLGVRPDLVAELRPDEARLVLASLAKSLATLVHPDRGKRRSVLGLDVADINQLSALIAHSDDATLGEVIDTTAKTSLIVQYQQREAELQSEVSHQTKVSEQLALTTLRGCESLANDVNASLVAPLYSPELSNPTAYLTLGIKNGVIVEAIEAEPKGALLSSLPDNTRQILEEIRPNLTDEAMYVHLDRLFPQQEDMNGWALLTDATAKDNPSIKKAAIKFLGTSQKSTPAGHLIGAYLIGAYTYDQINESEESRHVGSADKMLKKIALTRSATRLRTPELVHLMTKGYIEPFDGTSTQQKARLVFYKPNAHGNNGTGYIAPEIVAIEPIADV